jgi:hypothetical protein
MRLSYKLSQRARKCLPTTLHTQTVFGVTRRQAAAFAVRERIVISIGGS